MSTTYYYGYVPSGGTGGTGGVGPPGEPFRIDKYYLSFTNSDVVDIMSDFTININNIYIATILNDDRTNKNVPQELSGDISHHIIMYDGIHWYDWGLFIGDTGGTGGTGEKGGTGAIGPTLTGGTGNTGGSGGTGASGSGVHLAASQYQCTSTITATTTFTDVSFDTTNIENYNTVIKKNSTNTNQINIYSSGFYYIEYGTRSLASSTITTSNMQLYKNGTTIIPGSSFTQKTYQNETQDFTGFAIAEFSAGDYFTLQLSRGSEGSLTFPGPTNLAIHQLLGATGATGSRGLTGGSGGTGKDGSAVATGATGSRGLTGGTGGTGNTGHSGVSVIVQSTSPVGSVGELWYNTADNLLYYYDPIRLCWLSQNRQTLVFSASTANGAYLRPDGTVNNSSAGYYIGKTAIVVSVSAYRTNTNSTTMSLRNLGTSLSTYSWTSNSWFDNNYDLNLSAGTILQMYSSSSCSNVVVSLEIAWRQ